MCGSVLVGTAAAADGAAATACAPLQRPIRGIAFSSKSRKLAAGGDAGVVEVSFVLFLGIVVVGELAGRLTLTRYSPDHMLLRCPRWWGMLACLS